MIKFIEFGESINGEKIFDRVDEDGLIRLTCLAENPEYQAWLNGEEHLTENPTEDVE